MKLLKIFLLAYVVMITSIYGAEGSQPNVLWHNSTTGAIKFMPVNGMTTDNTLSVVDSSNTNLLPKGMGDFTGDGKPDILFHNQNSGNLRIWEMDGTTKVENIQVLGSSNTNLKIAGIGDFDGDGDNDIATFNTNSGALRIWVMEGTVRVDNVLVLTGANVNLVPRGAGDMDGDGIPDIVLRNNNSGAVRVWTMNDDLTRKGNEYVTGSSNTNLELRGVMDINGDGNNDILNYNTNTGKLRAWLMDGNLKITENAEIVQDAALEWSVRGGGDSELSYTIVLIPNEASAQINANNPVDINSSIVISQDQQKMVLAKDISISVDRPLFLDGIYQGMISSVESNTDDSVTVTFRDAEDLSEILDTFSMEVDTSESVVSSKNGGSTTQKLSSKKFSLYDKKNTKKMSYSLLNRNAKSTEGKNEPVLRIDIPADYQIPVTVKNNKITCDILDASCRGTFNGTKTSTIDLGESTTQNGITFSTEGSYVEIGLGIYMKLFADINTIEDDVLRFTLKESAYFKSKLIASFKGSLSAEWEKVIPLTKKIPVNIPVNPVVSVKLELQPYVIIGANGEISGGVTLSSYALRKGDMTFSFDSEIDGEGKMKTSKSIEFNPTEIDQDGIDVQIDANGEAFANAGIQIIPSVSLTSIMDILIGDIRSGIQASAIIQGEFDTDFEVVNDESSASLDSMAALWVETYPKIDYKLNIGIDPIGLDPILFYGQSDYTLLYQGDPFKIFDWKVSLLANPKVIQTPVNGATHVTFHIVADASVKQHIKFYYTTDGSDPIESSANLWAGSEIVVTEDTTIKVKAVLLVSDYSTSLWSFGKSISMTITEEVYYGDEDCPGEIDSEGVCIVSSYYGNGNLASETPYVNGVLEGILKSYYESGGLSEETSYVNGVLEGIWRTYYEDGVPSREISFVNDLRDGFWKEWNESGVLKFEVPYENGVLEGIKKTYYESGVLESATPYVNGVLEGIAKEYHENGNLAGETPYVNDVRKGIAKTYYESGALRVEVPYVNGVTEGILKRYYESGGLRSETPYVNGVQEGIAKGYYESGGLSSVAPHVNGILEGIAKEYYESGVLKFEIPYVNGVLEGIAKEYYESGELSDEIPYVNGVLEGIWKSYYKSGELSSTATYINGIFQDD